MGKIVRVENSFIQLGFFLPLLHGFENQTQSASFEYQVPLPAKPSWGHPRQVKV